MIKMLLILVAVGTLAGCNDGRTISLQKDDYNILCIDNISYVIVNSGHSSATMSVKLDKESKIVPCN